MCVDLCSAAMDDSKPLLDDDFAATLTVNSPLLDNDNENDHLNNDNHGGDYYQDQDQDEESGKEVAATATATAVEEVEVERRQGMSTPMKYALVCLLSRVSNSLLKQHVFLSVCLSVMSPFSCCIVVVIVCPIKENVP